MNHYREGLLPVNDSGSASAGGYCYNRRVFTQRRWLLLFIILLAFALRVFRLDAQSIWYDEGLSIQLAAQDPLQTIALSATTDHPPLHTLLLGVWLRVAGASDFVVRYLSVCFGVLVVGLTYALGKLYAERAGLIVAGLMALAPLAVYYSQETRGYMLLTALILVATLAALRLLNGDRRKRIWLAYLMSLALALYTHYFAAFAWAAINVGYIMLDFRSFYKLRKSFWHWLLAQFLVLVCFLPWIPHALAQAGSNATYFPGRVTWDTVFGETWRAFSVGEWGDMSLVGWLWLALILLGGSAAFTLFFKMQSEQQALRRTVAVVLVLLALLIIPFLLMSGLAWLKPKFAPRYLLPSLPAFVALASIGITSVIAGFKIRNRRWASIGVAMGAALTLALSLAAIGSLWRLYTDPALARPDVRAVVRYIENSELPSDAILLIGGHQAPAFQHYYRGQAAVIPLPPDLLPAVQSPLDARALSRLKAIVQQYPRVWLVLWQNQLSDPTNIIEETLVAEGKRINVGARFHDMGLLLFDVRAAEIAVAPHVALNLAFSEPVRAIGYNVDSRRIPIDTPLRFGLYLEAAASLTGNYRIFTHLVAADGTLLAQDDHIAGADSYPTSLWRPGNLLYNRFEIQPPAGTPPGEYQIIIGLYDEQGRLKLNDGRDHFKLFDVTLIP
ncbi:hypothetical protein TFLX_03083 [Thermoflexales bacterium]|nr:hypothetical protein TFLX_03083 [Thermoflexales bacterium]